MSSTIEDIAQSNGGSVFNPPDSFADSATDSDIQAINRRMLFALYRIAARDPTVASLRFGLTNHQIGWLNTLTEDVLEQIVDSVGGQSLFVLRTEAVPLLSEYPFGIVGAMLGVASTDRTGAAVSKHRHQTGVSK